MVPIKREPLTAFVSDTVAVPAFGDGGEGGGASGCYRPSGFISVPRGRGRRERERGDGDKAATRGRSNDTGYRVFHKDSMKIARDFITGEMSVNKNEYTGWSTRVRGGEEGRRKEERKSKEQSKEPFFSSALRSSS